MRAVDRLEVLVLVDNATDSLSTTPKFVIPEWPSLRRRRPAAAALRRGDLPRRITACRCCSPRTSMTQRHTLLFDAGPDGATLIRNAAILGVDFGEVEAIVLSHGHWDHGGGLVAAVAAVRSGAGRRRAAASCTRGCSASAARQRPDGVLHRAGAGWPSAPAAHRRRRPRRDHARASVLVRDVFRVSGEIPRVTPYETGLPGHVQRAADGGRGSRIPSSWTSASSRCCEGPRAVRLLGLLARRHRERPHPRARGVSGLPSRARWEASICPGSTEPIIPRPCRRPEALRPWLPRPRTLHRLAGHERDRSRVRRGAGPVRGG